MNENWRGRFFFLEPLHVGTDTIVSQRLGAWGDQHVITRDLCVESEAVQIRERTFKLITDY